MSFGRRNVSPEIQIALNQLRPARTTEIHASQGKTLFSFLMCLVFVVACSSSLQRHHGNTGTLQFGMIFFGLAAAMKAWQLIRPQRLVLDDEGFTLMGGFVRVPKKIRWRDIERFVVFRGARGFKAVGYNFKPGARSARFKIRVGADAILPKGWPHSSQKMVDELNAFRLRAQGG